LILLSLCKKVISSNLDEDELIEIFLWAALKSKWLVQRTTVRFTAPFQLRLAHNQISW